MALSIGEEEKLAAKVPLWRVERREMPKLFRDFSFKDFQEAMAFVVKVGVLAEAEAHHPNIFIFYNRVRLELYTHSEAGLSEKDFALAAKIDALDSTLK